MTIESATSVYELSTALPADGDEQAEGDDHIRMIKAVIKAALPGLGGALGRSSSKAITFSPAVTENTCLFHCTAGVTMNLLAVAGVPDGTHYFVNAFGGDVTVAPNGAELANGVATVVIPQNSWAFVAKVGTGWAVMVSRGLSPLVAGEIRAATQKATPVDADEFGMWDSVSQALRKLTFANLKALFMAVVAPGASGNILTSNGTAWTSAAPPAAGVTSVNGNTGAITSAQISAAATAGYGYTPANPANAATDHTHSYAPMTAVVAISNSFVEGYAGDNWTKLRATRANGATFDIVLSYWTSVGGGS